MERQKIRPDENGNIRAVDFPENADHMASSDDLPSIIAAILAPFGCGMADDMLIHGIDPRQSCHHRGPEGRGAKAAEGVRQGIFAGLKCSEIKRLSVAIQFPFSKRRHIRNG
ncbi:MAG: hypothetical protein DI605_06275 [Sphingomonas sp.]|nr:MAG: hypothetical protein DI605_06275 [Sphingomonas sp.]